VVQDGVAALFAGDKVGARHEAEDKTKLTELHAKIGQLALENDFLAGALGRIGDASAKR